MNRYTDRGYEYLEEYLESFDQNWYDLFPEEEGIDIAGLIEIMEAIVIGVNLIPILVEERRP